MFSCFCSCCALCGPRLINGWMLLSGSLHVQAPTSNIESLPPTRSLRHNRPSISPNIFIWIEIPFLIIGFHNYEVKQTEHILFISQAPAVMSSKSLDFFFHPSSLIGSLFVLWNTSWLNICVCDTVLHLRHCVPSWIRVRSSRRHFLCTLSMNQGTIDLQLCHHPWAEHHEARNSARASWGCNLPNSQSHIAKCPRKRAN